MPRNPTGTYSLTAGNPVVTGTVVESDWANTTMPDLGNELTDSLSRSGKGSMLAALKNINGGMATPSVTFTNDIRSGLYLNAVGDLRATSAQVDRMRWNASGAQVWDVTDSAWYQVISTKELEANAVLLTTNQTVDGVKTFTLSVKSSAAPVDAEDLTRKDYVDTLDAQNVKITTDQTVDGTKTFNEVVKSGEQPVDADDLTRKDYVDTAITTVSDESVKLTGDQSIAGVKTFTQVAKSVSAPSVAADLTNKAYVDSISGGGIGAIKSASRNTVLNQDPVSQGTAARAGMSSTIYTGNGGTQAVSTGVDMATGDFGGLAWIKERGAVDNHILTDTVRGTSSQLFSDLTLAEQTATTRVTSFDATGFSVGLGGDVNANLGTYAAWSWQTTEKTTGVTNRNKAYTTHYNSDLGFSITGFEGDATDGHETPHFLGKEPDLVMWKDRDNVNSWLVQSPFIGESVSGDYLLLNSTIATSNGAAFNTIFSDTTMSLGTGTIYNGASTNYIAYNFTSIPNVCKIGIHIGTGAAGNYVDCGFGTKKAVWVLIKNLTSSASWLVYDGSRNNGGSFLLPNSSNAEASASGVYEIQFVDGGFVIIGANVAINALNDQYIFMAYAEGTAFDGTKTLTNYDYATTDEVLTINEGTLMSFAEGFNANGELNSQELVGSGVTYSFGTGFEDKTLWVYKDRGGVYGSTEFRPLEGVNSAQADKFGLVSPLDAATRTTDKHFGYESATGVALASGETAGGFFAWNAFNLRNSNWAINSTTTSTLQYKLVEPRVLKSWRLRASGGATLRPRRFTIEGSNDGLVWTAIDSTYAAADYTGNGVSLWGDIQDTSANTTAYLYHRINITANNGDATFTEIKELEFNTITPSDYYNVVDGLVYNNAGTVIARDYLAKVMTGASGEILNYENLPVAKIKGVDAELQGNLTVHGDIVGANLFAQGQTWQDVTSQRAVGVTYTNNTGKPIEVSVIAQPNPNNIVALTIGGVLTARTQAYAAAVNCSVTGVVPADATYEIEIVGTLFAWSELRGINS